MTCVRLTLPALLLVLLGAACATTRSSRGEPGADPSTADGTIECRKESVVGSHMRQTVCRRKSQARADRDGAQQGLRQAPANAGPSEGP